MNDYNVGDMLEACEALQRNLDEIQRAIDAQAQEWYEHRRAEQEIA
jgi:hypothetical protein